MMHAEARHTCLCKCSADPGVSVDMWQVIELKVRGRLLRNAPCGHRLSGTAAAHATRHTCWRVRRTSNGSFACARPHSTSASTPAPRSGEQRTQGPRPPRLLTRNRPTVSVAGQRAPPCRRPGGPATPPAGSWRRSTARSGSRCTPSSAAPARCRRPGARTCARAPAASRRRPGAAHARGAHEVGGAGGSASRARPLPCFNRR
jgi:hypothetical protein